MKTVLLSCLLLWGSRVFATAGVLDGGTNEPVRVTPALLAELAARLRTNHPALKASQARVQASQANAASVRTWKDPVARAGYVAYSADTTPMSRMMSEEDGDLTYGLEQELPLFGKPAAARRVAESETVTSEAGAEYQFQLLRLDLNRAVLRAALADREVQLREQDLAWLDTLAGTLEQQHLVGQAPHLDFLRAKSERAKLADQLLTARRLLDHERVAVNRLLVRDFQAPVPRFELPGLAGPVPFSDRLADQAVEFEPKLRLMRREVDQAEAVVEATRRQRYPDVSVGVEGATYTGNGSFRSATVLLSLSLPWGNAAKYRQDIEREERKRQAIELDAVDYAAGVREEIHRLTTRVDAARREALLYREEIIPRAEMALTSSRAMWESGRGQFRDVMDARRMVVEGRLMEARAVSEQYQLLSELVLRCGLSDFDALQTMGAPVGKPPPQSP